MILPVGDRELTEAEQGRVVTMDGERLVCSDEVRIPYNITVWNGVASVIRAGGRAPTNYVEGKPAVGPSPCIALLGWKLHAHTLQNIYGLAGRDICGVSSLMLLQAKAPTIW